VILLYYKIEANFIIIIYNPMELRLIKSKQLICILAL